jgi:hypothetical protein
VDAGGVDEQVNMTVAAKLVRLQERAAKQPMSYKTLFDEALELAEEQFRRAMIAEAKLHKAGIDDPA